MGAFVSPLPTTFVLFSLCQLHSTDLTNLINSATQNNLCRRHWRDKSPFLFIPVFLSTIRQKLWFPLVNCVSVVQVVMWWMVIEHLHPSYKSRVCSTLGNSIQGAKVQSSISLCSLKKHAHYLNNELFRIKRLFFMNVWTVPNSTIEPWSPHKPLHASMI